MALLNLVRSSAISSIIRRQHVSQWWTVGRFSRNTSKGQKVCQQSEDLLELGTLNGHSRKYKEKCLLFPTSVLPFEALLWERRFLEILAGNPTGFSRLIATLQTSTKARNSCGLSLTRKVKIIDFGDDFTAKDSSFPVFFAIESGAQLFELCPWIHLRDLNNVWHQIFCPHRGELHIKTRISVVRWIGTHISKIYRMTQCCSVQTLISIQLEPWRMPFRLNELE